MRCRKEVDPQGKGRGKEPGGTEGGETIIGKYHRRKEFILS